MAFEDPNVGAPGATKAMPHSRQAAPIKREARIDVIVGFERELQEE